MLNSYLLSATRNIWRNKAFFFINLTGLAIGIAAFLIILAYVNWEYSFDSFHKDAHRLYRVSLDVYKDGTFEVSDAECYNLAGQTMKDEFEEIENFVNIRGLYTFSLSREDQHFKEDRVLYAESEFLKYFNFQLIHGKSADALAHPYSIVLTESLANKIFSGNAGQALGQTLILNGKHTATVTGVIQDPPANTHLRFNCLLSYNTGRAIYPGSNWEPNWNGNNGYTYVLLKDGAAASVLQEKLVGFSKRYLTNREEQLVIQPVRDIHLYSRKTFEISPNRNGDAIKLLFLTGVLILVIAWINYINLTTSRSMERAREVGIRKTLGSQKIDIIKQFMLESLIINSAAILLAVLLIDVMSPIVLQFLGTSELSWSFERVFLITGILIFLSGTLLSGFYPAWVISKYRPAIILKGNYQTSAKGLWLRKGLVVTQFVASFMLICGTLAIHLQLRYMQERDMGMNIDRVVAIPAPGNIPDSLARERLQTFRAKVVALPQVVQMGVSETLPGLGTSDLNSNSGNINRFDPDKRNAPVYYNFRVNETFFETLQIEMLAGKNFQTTAELNRDRIIINEEALRLLGFDSAQQAIDEKLYWGSYRPQIIGVIKNYHHLSLDSHHIPIIFFYEDTRGSYYTVRLDAMADFTKSLDDIQTIWIESFGESPFEYFFLDERFNDQYEADKQFSYLFSSFSFLAVFIACLGLLGLSAYSVVTRTKEIGIRKTLGASVSNLVIVLSFDFLKLIAVAVIFSAIASHQVIKMWLNTYAFRTELSWWTFVLPAVMLLSLALLTVGFHTVRAARANPIDSLRSE